VPTDTIIQALTMAALTGLLLASGLRLSLDEVLMALKDRRRFVRTLLLNFFGIPALAVGIVTLAGLPTDQSIGVLLLAAAPFAPVVPVFTRMAKGDLALAAGLTAIYPLFAALLTPWVSAASLRFLPGAGSIQFSVLTLLAVLLATITLPLIAGLVIHRCWPQLCRALLRPVEIASEAIGAVSLVFVSVVEWKTIAATGWWPLLTMAILFELALAAGYGFGGPSVTGRRVIALGTSNRNIALAILIAVQSFPGSPAVAAVVANGLLMIGLGLLHTGWWRLTSDHEKQDLERSG